MSRPRIVEIHGTGDQNRGALLMAIAIAEHIRANYPSCRLVVPPEFGSLASAHNHGFSFVNDFGNHWLNRAYIGLMPPNLHRKFNFVDPASVDVVLDASGFSFTDAWGPESANRLVEKMNRPKRRRQPLVLLPQAFGPFTSPAVADATRRVLRRASLICVRDKESLNHIQSLGEDFRVKIFPDFTGSVPAAPGGVMLPEQPYVVIVPNMRMLDKTASATTYLEFLSSLPSLISARGFKPLVVLHEGSEDANVIDLAGSAYDLVPRIIHADPRVLKWALGQASFVVGSRFHALVGALSQAVPSIGVGWSHKYIELFGDYDCTDTLVIDYSHKGAVLALLDQFANPNLLQNRRKALERRALIIKKQSDAMWRVVDTILESTPELPR